MKRPAFQFYPGDWKTNANLRRCSWAARGVWIEVMGLMHDSDVYGVLYWPLKEIAQAVGCPAALLRELADKGVMRGADAGLCEPFVYTPRSGRVDGEPVTLVEPSPGPIWYSSRMVRDEYVRGRIGVGSRFGGAAGGTGGGDGDAPKASLDPSPTRRKGEAKGDGKGDGPSSSSSLVSTTNQPLGTNSRAGALADPAPDAFARVCEAAGLVVSARREAGERAVLAGWLDGWTGCDVDRDVIGLIRGELPRRKGATSSLARFDKMITDAKARAMAAQAQAARFDHGDEGQPAADMRRAIEAALGAQAARVWLDPCRIVVTGEAVAIEAPSAFHRDWMRDNFAGVMRRPVGARGLDFHAKGVGLSS